MIRHMGPLLHPTAPVVGVDAVDICHGWVDLLASRHLASVDFPVGPWATPRSRLTTMSAEIALRWPADSSLHSHHYYAIEHAVREPSPHEQHPTGKHAAVIAGSGSLARGRADRGGAPFARAEPSSIEDTRFSLNHGGMAGRLLLLDGQRPESGRSLKHARCCVCASCRA
jgi:hypothetical protein